MFELRLRGGPAVASRLWERWGALSVGEADGVVVAGFADRAGAEAAASVEGGDVVPVDPADRRHLDAWRTWARPTRVGRLVVRPAWLPIVGAEVEVSIDPGPTFGHGGHPSTRLVLAALVERLGGGESVLDVGCGSGVLAVTAAALGAARAVAVDIEPAAAAVTRANAAANGVADRVEARVGSLGGVGPGHFDVVVANIGVVVLRELAPALARRVAPGGWLALSGLLEHQWPEVAVAAEGLSLVEAGTEEGWAAPVLQRPPGWSRPDAQRTASARRWGNATSTSLNVERPSAPTENRVTRTPAPYAAAASGRR